MGTRGFFFRGRGILQLFRGDARRFPTSGVIVVCRIVDFSREIFFSLEWWTLFVPNMGKCFFFRHRINAVLDQPKLRPLFRYFHPISCICKRSRETTTKPGASKLESNEPTFPYSQRVSVIKLSPPMYELPSYGGQFSGMSRGLTTPFFPNARSLANGRIFQMGVKLALTVVVGYIGGWGRWPSVRRKTWGIIFERGRTSAEVTNHHGTTWNSEPDLSSLVLLVFSSISRSRLTSRTLAQKFDNV